MRGGRDGSWWRLLVAGGLLTATASAQGEASAGTPGAVDPADKAVLVVARGKDSSTLDPAAATDQESAKVIDQIFETLVDFDEDPEHPARIVPCLATDWTASADRTAWTFNLREGVRFHDGTPFDAEAVKLSLERLARSGHPSAPNVVPYRTTFSTISEVEVLSPTRVRVLLGEPSVLMLRNLAMFSASIVSPAALRAGVEGFGRAPVGTGPFRFEAWTPGKSITLRRSEEWWVDAERRIERLQFVAVGEWSQRLAMLRDGKAHVVDDVVCEELAALDKAAGVVIQRAPGMNVCYLAMNLEQPPLDDAMVRRVVALAVDRARVLREAYHGDGQVATDLLPSRVPGRSLPIVPELDAAAARTLLASTVRANDAPLRFLYASEPRPYLPNPERVARLLAEDLEKAGFKVETKGHDFETFRDLVRRGEHHLALSGWSSDNGDPDNFYGPVLAETAIGVTNYVRLHSSHFEALLAASQAEEDPVVRFDLFRRMQAILAEELPVVPLVHGNLLQVCRTDVQGLVVHPIKLRLYGVKRA